ncbi:MAG: tryptophan synthase subunit alpha [Steroidobacteraceae bacterium]|nr:tryptophan synthase subunit alpha [Steroidobacteraceae bacterium]
MTPRDKISAAISHARGGNAIVAFITAGYPLREKFREHLTQVGNEADVVEIGVPFTDPMADGMTIQRSSREALAQGVSLRWLLDELAAMERPKAPIVLMSYLNPLLAFGFKKLADACARAGVCGFIVPDLPYDESEEFRAALDAHSIALIQMVTPVTGPARLKQLCAASQGFIYAVTMTGTTGRTASLGDVSKYLAAVRAVAKLPVCAGFGIRNREQVEALSEHCEGVIVGSALVEVLETGQDAAAFLKALRASG